MIIFSLYYYITQIICRILYRTHLFMNNYNQFFDSRKHKILYSIFKKQSQKENKDFFTYIYNPSISLFQQHCKLFNYYQKLYLQENPMRILRKKYTIQQQRQKLYKQLIDSLDAQTNELQNQRASSFNQTFGSQRSHSMEQLQNSLHTSISKYGKNANIKKTQNSVAFDVILDEPSKQTIDKAKKHFEDLYDKLYTETREKERNTIQQHIYNDYELTRDIEEKLKKTREFLANVDKKQQKLLETLQEKQKHDENTNQRIQNRIRNRMKDIKKHKETKRYSLIHETASSTLPYQPRQMTMDTTPSILENIKRRKVHINETIQSLDDLLRMIETYPLDFEIEYNINMGALHRIEKPLRRLKSMIGMKTLKISIVDQILYFMQGLHKNIQSSVQDGDFMHTCIYGSAGTGKTEIAEIMGDIFSRLGVLQTGKFKKVSRSDLVAGYLGQTAIKTKQVIQDAIGGVLFIDEAYALGNNEKRDSFAKECIDTLCEALSNHKHELMVIIAGYEEDLKKCFFAYNQGLDSRFTWRFKTDDYTPKEIRQIFIKKVYDIGWSFENIVEDIPLSWFETNKGYFKFYGRDMETLLSKVKIAHSRRVFCLDETHKRKINKDDLEQGFTMYLDNEEVKSRKHGDLPEFIRSIYQ